MIVTIDGPAGAGKSTVARKLAEQLGFRILDTGAMYRAVVHAALERGINFDDMNNLRRMARGLEIVVASEQVLIDGVDVTKEIRRAEVGQVIHYVADDPEIRGHLVELQRRAATGDDYVTEGRDQGTVAFPNADCKIFLTASPDERASRRLGELQRAGVQISLEEVRRQQDERDKRDRERPVGALRQAEDAVEFLTDGLTTEEVVAQLVQIVGDRFR